MQNIILKMLLGAFFISINLSPKPLVETQVTIIPPPPKEVPAILLKIAMCESKNKQFNEDGSVHMGVINPLDTGRFQINQKYHLENSKKLGMDIFTLEGNTDYALYLYKKNGTRDWDWSRDCWSK